MRQYCYPPLEGRCSKTNHIVLVLHGQRAFTLWPLEAQWKGMFIIMENRVNAFEPCVAMSYDDRIKILKERKLEHTKMKSKIGVYQDGDDYGSVPAPDDYRFQCVPNHQNGSWYGYKGWSENFYKLMCEHPVYIDSADAFTCRWMYSMIWFDEKSQEKGLNWNPDFPYDYLKKDQELYGIVTGIGADAHFGGDYEIGLSLGWGGLLEKLKIYREKNPEHTEFYDAEELVIRGIQNWMTRSIEECQRLAEEEKHPVLKSNLLQMAQVNQNILNDPPKTMREACQWVCWFNMASRTYNRDGAGFQLDVILKRYYDEDRKAGRITREEAVFYIACLLLNDPHYYQIGGLDENDRPILSDFSYLVLEGADKLDSTCNITVRVDENMDQKFLNTAVNYLFKNKNGWPRFSGDEALSKGFMRLGYSKELARKRIAVGCNWMSLPGLEYTLNDCVKINGAKVFEVALDEMMSGEEPYSTERLWEIYQRHMGRAVTVTAEGIAFHLRYQQYNEPELLLNLLSHGPVEKGLDVTCGGAMYYNLTIDGTGIATIADSFGALQQRIEDEKKIDWKTLYYHLKTDYQEDHGELIRQMMSRSARYGGGNTISDQWAVKISRSFSEQVRNISKKYPGYEFIPGWFSWSNTITLGKQVGATPNGRHAHDVINHGANPHPGFRKDGALTAMSNSICEIQPGYGNTAPVQLELDPGIGSGEEAVKKIADYIYTLFQKGATLLNINIIDGQKILDADKDPSKYPDLVVRVTGFTAYFCSLTPEFRKLVVDRILIQGS